jgi:hypothetical protein
MLMRPEKFLVSPTPLKGPSNMTPKERHAQAEARAVDASVLVELAEDALAHALEELDAAEIELAAAEQPQRSGRRRPSQK